MASELLVGYVLRCYRLSRPRLRLECWKMKSKEISRAQQTFTLLIISVFLYTHAACYPTLRNTIVCRVTIKM